MVDNLLKSEVDQQLLSDLVWKQHSRVKPSSLTYVIQQIESRKAHKTLHSAERAPTLSADGKVDQPFSKWRGVFLIILLLSFKKIVFYFLVKVDGMCPVRVGTNVP